MNLIQLIVTLGVPAFATDCDLLIIGAGISGAFTGHRYKQFNPDEKVCIVERGVRSGGRLQSLPLGNNGYAAEFGGMRYFNIENYFKLVPLLVQQLGLKTTELPYVDEAGIAYIRGKRLKLASLNQDLKQVYPNLNDDEIGMSPQEIYFKTVNSLLAQKNISLNQTLSDPYLQSRNMYNVLLPNMSHEAVMAYTDTAGYSWVLKANAAIVAQEDLVIESWNSKQLFLKNGFSSLVTSLLSGPVGSSLDIQYKTEVVDMVYNETGVVATLQKILPDNIADPAPQPVSATTTTISAKRVIFTGNPLQAIQIAKWPWQVQSLLFDVDQIEAVKIFIKFDHDWWTETGVTLGRSVTDLPLRQVWAYAPGVLMVYADALAARYWKPFLDSKSVSYPAWKDPTELPDLMEHLYNQLSKMYGVPVANVSCASKVAYAYWSKCTGFWRPGCDVKKHIATSSEPIPGMPVHFATDLWSTKQGWVEGALTSSEGVLARLGVPSIVEKPASPPRTRLRGLQIQIPL
jgi:monoamine oxidase